MGNPAVAARAGEDSDPALRPVEPAAVLWCLMDPEPRSLSGHGAGRRAPAGGTVSQGTDSLWMLGVSPTPMITGRG